MITMAVTWDSFVLQVGACPRRPAKAINMQSPVPGGKPMINHQAELEARIQALEAIVGALLRFSAGQQSLADALKEARQRGEAYLRDPANNAAPDYVAFYRESLRALALTMVPLADLETFQATLQDMNTAFNTGSAEDARGACSS